MLLGEYVSWYEPRMVLISHTLVQYMYQRIFIASISKFLQYNEIRTNLV